MKANSTLKEQFRRNAVALISLAIAITSLGYNTWRNEASEENRNQRLISIEMLLMLGELQQLVMDRHYGVNVDGPAINRRAWGKVLTIRDLSRIASGAVPAAAETLYEVWRANFDKLEKFPQATAEQDAAAVAAKDRVIAALEALRSDTHDVLRSLD